MTSQQFLVCDSSTFANFSSWASAVSSFLAACGMLQARDTGQVMFSGMTLTTVAMSGTTATYTYTSLTGPTPAVGRAFTITGMTNGANNGTFRVTAIGAGTFSVTNASGVNESGSTGHVTANTTVPGTSAFVYEIWQPGDAFQNFYLKMEYGNASGSSNCPTFRMSIGVATDGAGTLTGGGGIVGPYPVAQSTFTAPSSSLTYECDFSGDSSGFSILMWRNGANSCQQAFVVERSLNTSGVYYGTSSTGYVTLVVVGPPGSSSTQRPVAVQQTYLFGVGPSPITDRTQVNATDFLAVRQALVNGQTSTAFNGGIPFDTVTPVIGYFDLPMTRIGIANGADIVEGVTFTATLYGTSRTFMPTKAGNYMRFAANTAGYAALCVRSD